MSPQALKPSVPMAAEGPGARASSGPASLEGRSIDCFSLAIIQALAKSQMERRLRNRRKNSSLPALIELVLARPLVSAGLVAAELKISQRAALGLVPNSASVR
ncbi:helix-turn-helix domain-containing protein [Mesorhizobium sp.]|uniref:helix-turn-helix domain-containing protein n=1 Tax=Mesorhizobium sp. TaxID=1871066 RepID=UPI0025CBB16D|nr:helix-turn-helix domain-containing protein [Mesorhizobium sp.]